MGFIKAYIQLFAYSSVTTEEWKNYLFTYFKDKVRLTWSCSWSECSDLNDDRDGSVGGDVFRLTEQSMFQ